MWNEVHHRNSQSKHVFKDNYLANYRSHVPVQCCNRQIGKEDVTYREKGQKQALLHAGNNGSFVTLAKISLPCGANTIC